MSRFHALTIADVRRETAESVSVAFAIPDRLRDAYAYVPGQYLTLKASIGGEDIRRSYSICSGLDDGEVRVAIKKVEGGAFSTFANENLAPGMELDVMAPDGRFTAAPDPDAAHDYVAFAAGSGVTPVLAIVKTVLAREPHSRVTLFYGNRDVGSILFREALEELKDRFLDRFTLVHVLSRESQDVELLHGRLTAERIERFADAGLFDPKGVDGVFLCGPGDMIASARKMLERLGVASDRIHFELFTPDGEAPRPVSDRARAAAEAGVGVKAILDGATRQFAMTAEDANLVDAAGRQGLELPYSCKGGMCCTCRCKLVAGEVEMATNYSLQPWELEAGYVLACQSRPLTEEVVVDFDAV